MGFLKNVSPLLPEQVTPGAALKITEAIGNNPVRMVGLLALTTFSEGEYVSTDRMNRRVQDLIAKAGPATETSSVEDMLHHCFRRFYVPAGLAEPQGHPNGGWRLKEERRSLGAAVCGTLLSLELQDSSSSFLAPVLGSHSCINKRNPRLPIYRRLLESAASPAELLSVSKQQRSGQNQLVHELCAAGVLRRKCTSNTVSIISISDAFRPRISELIHGLELLDSTGDKADKFRYNAIQTAEAITGSPPLLAQLVSRRSNEKDNREAWIPAARKIIPVHGEISIPDLYRQVVAASGSHVNYKTFGANIRDMKFPDRTITMRRDRTEHSQQVTILSATSHASRRARREAINRKRPRTARLSTWREAGPPVPLDSIPSPHLRFSATWADHGLCRDEEQDLFFPPSTAGQSIQQAEKAKAVCRQCPVWPACLKNAVDTGTRFGVSGGVWLEAGELSPRLRELAAKVKIIRQV